MNRNRKVDWNGARPILALALVSLVICGLLFPLLITGIAQVVAPHQANGEIVQFEGRAVGSNLIAQNFTRPFFFHPRIGSASGVDPDITVTEAISQARRISTATGIPVDALDSLISQKTDKLSLFLGNPYVNVLSLNLAMIEEYPTIYSSYR